jgi:general secretion pathway protein K
MNRAGARAGHQGGFILINALVLVAALAAAAVFMLARAEAVRLRSAAALEGAQLGLYLDAFEALALELLERDAAGGTPIDHSGESWARDLPPVPLDRGAVSGRISDLQGRFNLNRLANPEDAFSRASFERLAQRLGLSPQRVEEIVAFITPGGAGNENAFARASPPMVPVGGALLMREQLGLIPTLSERDLARLSPHVTVLPVAATLNVNTATPEVLASLFDSANAAGLAALVQEAKRQPFASPEAFVEELIKIVPPTELQELPDGFLGIGSTWFEAEIAAELDGRVVRRRAVINRLPLPQTPLVAYRLDNWK